jgi:hypothetical protein
MYERINKLTIGTGDATGLVQRIQSDLSALVEGAAGFIAYTAVEVDAQTVVTVRLFRDSGSMDAETQSTSAITDAIANDFQLTNDMIADGETNIGIANVLTEEFQP